MHRITDVVDFDKLGMLGPKASLAHDVKKRTSLAARGLHRECIAELLADLWVNDLVDKLHFPYPVVVMDFDNCESEYLLLLALDSESYLFTLAIFHNRDNLMLAIHVLPPNWNEKGLNELHPRERRSGLDLGERNPKLHIFNINEFVVFFVHRRPRNLPLIVVEALLKEP